MCAKNDSLIPTCSVSLLTSAFELFGELPHAKAVKLPGSLTELALTYGILLKYLMNNKVEDSISTGVNSVRTVPTRFNPSLSMFMLEL